MGRKGRELRLNDCGHVALHYSKGLCITCYNRLPDRIAAKKKLARDKWIVNGMAIFAWKRSHPCVDCGEDDPVVLEFDHVDGQKVKNISQMTGAKTLDLLREIMKCEVVCANCHRRRTAKRGQHHKYGAE